MNNIIQFKLMLKHINHEFIFKSTCKDYIKLINKNDIKFFSRFKTSLTKLLKHDNLTILKYINNYVQPLELCGFCNKNLSDYIYKIKIQNNEIMFYDIKLKNDYSCSNIECRHQRASINPNSFEHISKRKKISINEANIWQKNNNKSPFYKHPWDSPEEYKNRQKRTLTWFKNKFGDIGEQKFLEHNKKISEANKKENVIKKHGIEYANKLSELKKQNLKNFIKRYGEEEGKKRYIKFIKATTITGIYIKDKKIIDSKIAFNFFKNLENELIINNIIDKNDITYSDGKRVEYKILYFNEKHLLRWFKLDFTILSYKIDIEFNGSYWHFPNDKIPTNEREIAIQKYDIRRDKIICQHGFKIIKIWDHEISSSYKEKQKIENVIKQIKEIINNERN